MPELLVEYLLSRSIDQWTQSRQQPKRWLDLALFTGGLEDHADA